MPWPDRSQWLANQIAPLPNYLQPISARFRVCQAALPKNVQQIFHEVLVTSIQAMKLKRCQLTCQFTKLSSQKPVYLYIKIKALKNFNKVISPSFCIKHWTCVGVSDVASKFRAKNHSKLTFMQFFEGVRKLLTAIRNICHDVWLSSWTQP